MWEMLKVNSLTCFLFLPYALHKGFLITYRKMFLLIWQSTSGTNKLTWLFSTVAPCSLTLLGINNEANRWINVSYFSTMGIEVWLCWPYWHILIIKELKRMWQEDYELKATLSHTFLNWIWWLTLLIPALGRLMKKELNFKTNLGLHSKTLYQKAKTNQTLCLLRNNIKLSPN